MIQLHKLSIFGQLSRRRLNILVILGKILDRYPQILWLFDLIWNYGEGMEANFWRISVPFGPNNLYFRVKSADNKVFQTNSTENRF